MPELKTDKALLEALNKAARRPLTAAELQRQRVSYVMGMVSENNTSTRAQVENILREHEGHKAQQ